MTTKIDDQVDQELVSETMSVPETIQLGMRKLGMKTKKEEDKKETEKTNRKPL